MKLFLSVLYTVFLFAMGTGIYIAYRDAEGLVESNYYEAAKNYFRTKSSEQSLGLAVGLSDSLKRGENTVTATVTSHGKAFEKASVHLFIGNLSEKDYDSRIVMREKAPGIYQAKAYIPYRGTWLVRLDLENAQLKTSRKWFVELD
jgi:nitrogen fixation protein FixH